MNEIHCSQRMGYSDTNLVDDFLTEFKVKLKIWNVVFLSNRQKNTQTLAELEISVNEAIDVLANLSVTDYSEGPVTDQMLSGADMWVFGRDVKGHEIYIKVTLGRVSSPVICISFHFAEYPMKYPFKP